MKFNRVFLEKSTLAIDKVNLDQRQTKKAQIAFLFTHGFVARMVLRSGVARSLISKGIQVVVISPNADEIYFQQECQQEGVILKQSPPITGFHGRIADLCRSYRLYFLDDVINNAVYKNKHKSIFKKHNLLGSIMLMINRRLAVLQTFRSIYRFIESKVNRSHEVKNFLSNLRPDYLILAYAFGRDETVYLIHAKELGIPTICQVLSWDNITAKGTPLLMPDHFISWGPIMTEEIMNLYHFPKDRIYECGVPHFDVYLQKQYLTSREVLLKELNIHPEQPYVLYGMVAPYSSPNELEILTWLVNQINTNAFVKPCSLVIRPHPQTIRGAFARDSKELERIYALAGPRVVLDIPPVLSDQLAWDLPKSDMCRLAGLLAGSAMCLTAGSTLCLEACILDRPTLLVSFDGWEELPYEMSARQGLDYTHLAKLLALGGVRVAKSFSDLEENINAYLDNPCLDQKERAWSAARECGVQDGQAVKRVVTTLVRLIQQSQ